MKNPLLLLPVLALGLLAPVAAQTAIDLGAAASFGVLGTSTVTNSGTSSLQGDFGVSPGTTYAGFPSGLVVTGAIHAADAAAAQAHADAVTVFNILGGQTPTQILTGQDLGSRTLGAGVYFFDATAQLTGVLTLDGGGDPAARFDFLIGSTLGTAAASQVLLANGAYADNVYWRVGSSATFLTSSTFAGTVLAGASITANSGAAFEGRLLALGAAVTLDGNSISVPVAIPEPAVTGLFIAACMGGITGLRRFRSRRLAAAPVKRS